VACNRNSSARTPVDAALQHHAGGFSGFMSED
jgi:hypothetical protein